MVLSVSQVKNFVTNTHVHQIIIFFFARQIVCNLDFQTEIEIKIFPTASVTKSCECVRPACTSSHLHFITYIFLIASS